MGFASISAPSFKNLEGISSIPGALETFKQDSSFLVMISVIYKGSSFSVFGFSFLWNIFVLFALNLRDGSWSLLTKFPTNSE